MTGRFGRMSHKISGCICNIKKGPLTNHEFLCSPPGGSTVKAAHSGAHQDTAKRINKLQINAPPNEDSESHHLRNRIVSALTNSLLILRPKSFSGCATSLSSFTFPAEDELEQEMMITILSVVTKCWFYVRIKKNYNIPGWLVIT